MTTDTPDFQALNPEGTREVDPRDAHATTLNSQRKRGACSGLTLTIGPMITGGAATSWLPVKCAIVAAGSEITFAAGPEIYRTRTSELGRPRDKAVEAR